MLKLVSYQVEVHGAAPPLGDSRPQDFIFHQQLLDGYLQSHKIRNHSINTIHETKRLLTGWFAMHGSGNRPLFTWEAMAPIYGRRRIAVYCKGLIESEVAGSTIRRYVGMLRGYFSYVLEHPYVFEGELTRRLCDLYSSLEQPVSEFDMPVHVFNGETLGVPLDPARLYEFYGAIRKHYLAKRGNLHVMARNYAMVVLAGESGLRSDEISHLETELDLFFASRRLQTRHAKAARGSGKRSRVTLFTPLARDTIQFYLKHHRPYLINGGVKSPYLFPSRRGRVLTHAAMLYAMNRIKETLRINDFSLGEHLGWHWMRRLFATRFIEQFPHQLSVLVELLGHQTPNTVHAYIRHSNAWMDEKIIQALEGSGRLK